MTGVTNNDNELPHTLRMGHFAQALLNPEQQAPQGVGREGGPEGLSAFLETKTIVLDAPAA